MWNHLICWDQNLWLIDWLISILGCIGSISGILRRGDCWYHFAIIRIKKNQMHVRERGCLDFSPVTRNSIIRDITNTISVSIVVLERGRLECLNLDKRVRSKRKPIVVKSGLIITGNGVPLKGWKACQSGADFLMNEGFKQN